MIDTTSLESFYRLNSCDTRRIIRSQLFHATKQDLEDIEQEFYYRCLNYNILGNYDSSRAGYDSSTAGFDTYLYRSISNCVQGWVNTWHPDSTWCQGIYRELAPAYCNNTSLESLEVVERISKFRLYIQKSPQPYRSSALKVLDLKLAGKFDINKPTHRKRYYFRYMKLLKRFNRLNSLEDAV